MIIPIGDAPNPRGVPVATWAIIAVNVGVYAVFTLPLSFVAPSPADPLLGQYVDVMRRALHGQASTRAILAHVSAYDLFLFRHGFRSAAPSAASLLAAMFLHGGFLHLFGNMLFLWIYGDNVEDRLGRLWYVVAYLGTGIAATVFYALGTGPTDVPMVGASGAISGVLGFYFVWFPRNVVRLFWLLPPFLMDVVTVPARLVLGVYLVLDNLLPYLIGGETSGVAHGAHIGGFAAGVAAAWLIQRRAVTARPAGYRGGGDPRLDGGVAGAIRAGALADAAEAYFALPARDPRAVLDAADAIRLAAWLRDARHPEPALVVLRRWLHDHPRDAARDEAHVLAGDILLDDLGQPTPAYQHFLEALDLSPAPDVAARARRGLAAIEALQKRRTRRAP
jgi:membrane associated rhomboid family serine protease